MLSAMTELLHRNIENILADLLVRSEGEAAFLCDRGGNIMAQSATNPYAQEENMAALAAGSFYATRELAKLLGEPEFQCVFHQGDTNSVYMQSTRFDMLVLVIFGSESNPGLVRLYSTECCEALDKLMEKADSEAPAPTASSPVFEIDETIQPFQQVTGFGSA
jgi:predicted regulator of Ras-like GTPase activity (Roadblock/LC7/MglB family)